MQTIRHWFAIGAVLLGTGIDSFAYTSTWSGVAAAGDFTRWDTMPSLMLVADHIWQGEFNVTAASNSFKFVANNSWTYSWRQTNHPGAYTVPFTGRVDTLGNASGGDIVITNMAQGLYQFTFNDSNWTYRVDLLYTLASGVNILQNPSFEDQGSDSERAYYWQYNNPDVHGSTWNTPDLSSGYTPKRRNWRGHSGSWEAAIEGRWWDGRDKFGGWWREGAATPGLTYQGSAWFWADASSGNTFTAAVMEVKIEFYDTNVVLLSALSTNFTDVNQSWKKKIITSIAPPNTAWARLVVDTDGNGPQGSLQFDDIELRAVYTRTQDFNQWAAFTNDGNNTWDNWVVCTGKTTLVNARSGYCASLPWGAGQTNSIRSPLLSDGLGTVSLWYRNAATDAEATGMVSFLVQKSLDGATWTTIASQSNILSQTYRQMMVFACETDPYYLRIVHDSGTNRLLIDDIAVALPVPSPRYMDFNTWPDSATNMGLYNYLEWELRTGSVSSVNAIDGKAALLPGNTSVTGNTLRTPYFSSGYGPISFWYARGTNTSTPARFNVERSINGVDWTIIDVVSNIVNTGYEQYNQYFYDTNASYLRICNISNAATAGGETILVDEGFNGGAASPPPGWTYSGVTEYSTAGNYGRASPSLRFDSDGDSVTTPTIANPTNLSFWLKGVSTGSNPNHFYVDALSNASWVAVADISPLPTTGTNLNYAVNPAFTAFRFRYNKVLGNAAFDDVIIRGLAGAGGLPLQSLYIDNVYVDWPVLYRSQNFDDWPAETSYGDYRFQGWFVHRAIISDSRAYAGQAARLEDTVGNHAYIQSPYIPNGLGTISFVYARWTDGTPAVSNLVQVSPDGTNWNYLSYTVTTATTYAAFSRYMNDTNSHYLRIYHQSGAEAQLIDEIVIGTPQPPADIILNGWHSPNAPYTNDSVFFSASAYPQYGGSALSVTTYYRIGTSGVFSPLSMIITDRVNYITVTSVPPQIAGTKVQYFMKCNFTGPGSESNSPRYYPSSGSNSPAWYAVPRNRSGKVWINEVNYLNALDFFDDTNEFVELCGPAGVDISGWRVELYVSVATNQFYYYGTYVIPDGAVMSNEINGYGFYVLGDPELSAKDQTLTYTNEIDYTQISDGDYPSGVRLYNEGGGIEQSVSYRGPIAGFTTLYAEEDYSSNPDPYSLQLAGIGTNYADFGWRTNSMTPGAANVAQQFGTNATDVVTIAIGGFARAGGQLSITMAGTNGWGPEVWYLSALLPNPQSWTLISPRTVTTNAGIWTIQFAYPAGLNNCCFRVEAVKP